MEPNLLDERFRFFNFSPNHPRLGVMSSSKVVHRDPDDTLPRCTLENGVYVTPKHFNNKAKGIMDVLGGITTAKRTTLKLPGVKCNDDLIKEQKLNRSLVDRTDKPHYSWMGHARCYFQSDGVYYLTDPVFSARCSPTQWFGPKRIVDAPTDYGKDIQVDVVLLSHTHYDHLDEMTVNALGNKPLWIVPKGVAPFLASHKVTNVVELDWWDSYFLSLPSRDEEGKTESKAQAQIVFTPSGMTAQFMFPVVIFTALFVLSPICILT
jgi:hypothetical protein